MSWCGRCWVYVCEEILITEGDQESREGILDENEVWEMCAKKKMHIKRG